MESRIKANITILNYHETWKFPFSFIRILTRNPVISALVNGSVKLQGYSNMLSACNNPG